jgi:predicted esterase
MATTVAVATALATATVPAVAVARPVPRPDLVVSKGTVKVAGGKVTGTFVVANDGRARAARSSAALTVRTAGHRWKLVKHFGLPALSRDATRTITIAVTLPTRGLASGTPRLRVCADDAGDLREHSEANNCRALRVTAAKAPGAPGLPSPVTPVPPVAPAPVPTPAPAPAPAPPVSSVPAAPVPYTPETPLELSRSWVDVPASYDATHQTPTALFVWMHGCGGESGGDIYTISPGGDAQHYLALSVKGAEGGCWDMNSDPARVLAAIAEVKTHFNVNPRRVILGGYSSGGDLAYRTAFYNAKTFAGLLIENSSPFRDTGSTREQSLAAAAWRFPVIHLAHTEDDTYGIAVVRDETGAMVAAGFPLTLVERPGGHGDATTDPDLQALLLPHIDADGWLAPAS